MVFEKEKKTTVQVTRARINGERKSFGLNAANERNDNNIIKAGNFTWFKSSECVLLK